MEYNFREIEEKWQKYWIENKTYKTDININKPKFYVLDMFPYPSGAGLHVGHPLGYIASDIYSRYKRLQGFNVLHPMGYDAYGLPAEQYAIQTGQHPAITTEKNISRYREQLDKIGFCYDWDREVRTCDPDYYKWTQWAFIQMFNHYFDIKEQRAKSITELVKQFEVSGTKEIHADITNELNFTAEEWNSKSEKEQQEILLNYRIAYLADLKVNWCPALGTVLANDEVSEGLSIRGGHPVEQKVMRQWSLRVSAYAQRLLDGLNKIDWTESLKETQKNWIGRSEGAEMTFKLKGKDYAFDIFTTRADTIFGVTFMVLAPESELVEICTTEEQKYAVKEYLDATKKRTERERIADRRVTGVFSGSYAINPVTEEAIPIWISDYVLAGYGTGAIMAVPAHDSRDYAFAKYFNLPIVPVIEGADISEESFDAKDGIMTNSGFLNGLTVKEAIAKTKKYISEKGIGKVKVNYRLRDAIFSRQRYWGEPFPVYYKEGMPYMLDESTLPLELPEVDKFLPTETGEPPLGRAKNWVYTPPQTLPNGKGVMEKSNSALRQKPNYYTTDAQYWHLLIDNSKRMRQKPTEAESVLWNLLRDKKIGYKFRQQHPIDIFIPDFVCLSKKIIVEIDGEYNLTEEQIKLDTERTQILEMSGYKIIRFNNNEVIKNPHAVVEIIKNELEKRTIVSENTDESYSPSPEERAGVRSYPLELNTMPGFAGSSAYYLRYMDPHNDKALVSKEADEYWRNVDLYIGGTEHATGHLIYSRFWNKFLFDLGIVCEDEPFKKLINQGMIQGRSNFVYRIQGTNTFVSLNLKDKYETTPIHVDVNMVSNDILDIERFKNWNPEYKNAEFILEDGKYVCGWAVEKMSKSMFNVVNPDDIVEKYGADTLRLYEMFLGPLEQSKPWDTNGIDGVHRFLKRLWSLFYNGETLNISDETPSAEELKTLHKTIKKIGGDIETFSFNTSVSAFMICVNELYTLKCNKKAILEPLAIILTPFAPHIAEEMYHLLGNNSTVCDAIWPKFNEEYLKESKVKYPISFNGKVRFTMELPADMSKENVEKSALANELTLKYLEEKIPKKIIVVPGKIVNIVI